MVTPSVGMQYPRANFNSRGSLPSIGSTILHLMGLKTKIIVAGLTRSTMTVVGTILGGLWCLVVVVSWSFALYKIPDIIPGEHIANVAIIIGALATLSWWVLAFISARIDSTLHSSQFSLFPLPSWGIMGAQIFGWLIGFIGPSTAILTLAHATMWRHHSLAFWVAFILAPLAWFSMILGNCCARAFWERFIYRRRFNDLLSVVALVSLVLAGPIVLLFGFTLDDLLDSAPVIAGVVSWTPVGFLWAIPGDVATGNYVQALARFVLALFTVLVLMRLWRSALEKSLESGVTASAGGGGKDVVGVGLFDRMPASSWGAVAARCLIFWLKDPRYSGSLLAIPALFLLFLFYKDPILAVGPVTAILMAYSISADVSYDHKGFSLHLITGVSGFADRLGRVVGMLFIGVSFTFLGILVSLMVTSRWDLWAGVTGTSILALLGGAGLSSVASARYTYPVPLPGNSPLKIPPGTTVLNVLFQMAVMFLACVLSVPSLTFFIVQLITGDALWGWLSLGISMVLGPVLCYAGIWLGGKWLDARGPELLTQVSNYR